MKLILAFVLAATAAEAVAQTSALKVTLKDKARVCGDWITIGDVAEVAGGTAEKAAELGALKLGRAPLPGVERELTAAQVEKRIREMGFSEPLEFSASPAAVMVTAAVRPIPGSDLVEFARAHLESKLDFPGGKIEIEDPKTPRALIVPDVEPELRAEITGRRFLGLVPVAVEVFSRGKKEARIILSFRVRVTAPVPAAARAMETGEVVSEADLEDRERELSMLPETICVRREEIVGLKLVRPLAAGAFVRRESVDRPDVLKKGSQVILVARVGTVEVRASAQAKDGGAAGEMVSVVNVASKKTIKARVVDEETVEVVIP